MGVMDLFRRPRPIATAAGLEDFLDSRAAFLVQKCIYEYARARCGLHWQKLFKEEAFIEALERSRWSNYPIALGCVAEMVLGVLRRRSDGEAAVLAEAVTGAARAVTRRYPARGAFDDAFWQAAADGIEARLARAALVEPKPVKDIPVPDRQRFFDQLPLHESLRDHDFVLVSNNVRMNLCQMFDDFEARVRADALVSDLAPVAAAGS